MMETRGQFHQYVYAQLLRKQVSKGKKLLDLTVFFVLLGSAHVKAARKMMVKLTQGQKYKGRIQDGRKLVTMTYNRAEETIRLRL